MRRTVLNFNGWAVFIDCVKHTLTHTHRRIQISKIYFLLEAPWRIRKKTVWLMEKWRWTKLSFLSCMSFDFFFIFNLNVSSIASQYAWYSSHDGYYFDFILFWFVSLTLFFFIFQLKFWMERYDIALYVYTFFSASKVHLINA